jgi:hypothetical protein
VPPGSLERLTRTRTVTLIPCMCRAGALPGSAEPPSTPSTRGRPLGRHAGAASACTRGRVPGHGLGPNRSGVLGAVRRGGGGWCEAGRGAAPAPGVAHAPYTVRQALLGWWSGLTVPPTRLLVPRCRRLGASWHPGAPSIVEWCGATSKVCAETFGDLNIGTKSKLLRIFAEFSRLWIELWVAMNSTRSSKAMSLRSDDILDSNLIRDNS